MNILTYYDPTVSTELCEIMHKWGSDKGAPGNKGWHNYTTFYKALFEPAKDRIRRVFELGLGTNNVWIPSNMGVNGKPGASLRGWREYFPTAQIFGADIDKDILFTEDRIKTYYCDQLSPESIENLWNEPELTEGFDIIIEDGLHEYKANKCFFECSIHKLNKGGVYIIEDVSIDYLKQIVSLMEEWQKQYSQLAFRLVEIPHRNVHDNKLVVIQRN